MNKTEFISTVATKTELTKKDTTATFDAMLETIKETLVKGDSVSFIGFGTFSTAKRKARTTRNPATGGTINLPETTIAKFKAGKVLKEAVK